MKIKVKTKKWGNSVGVRIPKKAVKQLDINPEDVVILDVEKEERNPLKELFGALPMEEPAKKVLDETRKEMESKHI